MSGPDAYRRLNDLELPSTLRGMTLAELAPLTARLRGRLGTSVAASPERLLRDLAAIELAIALHYVFDVRHDRILWEGEAQPGGSAIGTALGMAVAAARLGEARHAVAVIEAHALTAGMAFEALNHAGALRADLLVVLEDADPGSRDPGALSGQLAQVLSGPLYAHLRAGTREVLRPLPTVRELARRSEQHLKGMLLPGTIFEELGFNYIGPVDGQDIATLVATLRNLRRLRGPRLLHVVTHPQSPPGRVCSAERPSAQPGARYGELLARWLGEAMPGDRTLVLVTPAARGDAALREIALRFPDRCFDVSTAAQHAVTFAAGLAAEGLRPVLAITSTLLQRAYDQLIHDVALQNLPLVLALHPDGDTGHDLSYLRCVPHLTLMTAANAMECQQMLYTACRLPGPTAVRFPGAACTSAATGATGHSSASHHGRICHEGRSGLGILVFGALLEAAELATYRLDATLASMGFVKPLDEGLLAALCARHRALITIEDNVIRGGAGTAVAEWLARGAPAMPLLQLGISEPLDARALLERIERWWLSQNPEMLRAAGGQ